VLLFHLVLAVSPLQTAHDEVPAGNVLEVADEEHVDGGPAEGADNRPTAGSVPAGLQLQPHGSWQDYLTSFFRRLREEQITSLVLDLRHNTGGRPQLAVKLLRYLLREPFTYLDASDEKVEMFTYNGFSTFYEPFDPYADQGFHGRLYVLINGGCFSQTGQVCSMLEAHGVATFIGEETGGGFSCNDNSTVLTLPNSGLNCTLATVAFETSAQELTRGRGILPDVEVRPTIDDLITGNDPVLGWIDRHLGTDLERRSRQE